MASNALERIGPIPRGRPTAYDEEIAYEICRRIAGGEILTDICEDGDMPGRTTVYDWLNRYPDFSEQYASAREFQADGEADQTIKIADDLAILPEHKRVMVAARQWRAERLNRRVFGNKVDHAHAVQLRPAAGAEQLPEGIGFLRGFLHGGDAGTRPGPDPSGVGEE